jgi:adenosylhomocysteine nucleosidase
VVSAGTCGALDPTLAAGNLVVPRTVIGPDGSRVGVDPVAHERTVMAVMTAGWAACTEPLATVTEIVGTPAAKAALRAATGAVAVDMESTIVLAAAAEQGIPAIVVRGVADTAHQALPRELTALVDDAGRTSAVRAAGLLARRPGLLRSALTLQRGTARALDSVAAVLSRL